MRGSKEVQYGNMNTKNKYDATVVRFILKAESKVIQQLHFTFTRKYLEVIVPSSEVEAEVHVMKLYLFLTN